MATRSEGACWTASKGSVTRYATFASRYNPMTIIVPSASDSGILRRGSFTSPAVNVMLFHASAENSDPVWATQMATNRPNVVTAASPGTISTPPRSCHNAPKLSDTAAVLPTGNQADQNERRQGAALRRREDVLDDPPVLEAARVRPREQRDQQHAHQLRRRQRQRVSRSSGALARTR